MNNPDLANPFPPDHGRAAYNCIMKFLKARKLTNTGGCKAFYTPQQWVEKGEKFGQNALLIVVHDGGDLARCFNWDYESPLYKKMIKHLEDNGFWAEALTCWATAIYL